MRKIASCVVALIGALVLTASAGAEERTVASQESKTSCDIAGLAGQALAELEARQRDLPTPADLLDR